jgi:hypothetical protein
MKTFRIKLQSFIVLFAMSAFCEHFAELAGDLPHLISAQKSPYLIVSDIYVPAGKSVTIEAGTVFLFKNFTGFHVEGILYVKGTDLDPVVFTSESDNGYNPYSSLNPTPYDWNGIYLHKDAIGTDMQNLKINYSVKGIVSETKYFRLTDAVFRENGRSNLSIAGEEKLVTPDQSYTYTLSIKDATVDGVPVKILMDPEAPKRNTFRYTGLALCVGGAALGGIFGVEWNNSQIDLKNISTTTKENLRNDSGNEIWHKTYEERNKSRVLTAVGILTMLTGGFFFTWSFTF